MVSSQHHGKRVLQNRGTPILPLDPESEVLHTTRNVHGSENEKAAGVGHIYGAHLAMMTTVGARLEIAQELRLFVTIGIGTGIGTVNAMAMTNSPFATIGMIEPTGTDTAPEAGPRLEIGIETETETEIGIEIAAATEIETMIDIALETAIALVTDETDRVGGGATIHVPGPDPESAHVPGLGPVQLVDDLVPVVDLALVGVRLVSSISTAMCRRRATGVDRLADDCGHRTGMIGRGSWKLTVIFLAVLL